MRLNRDEFGNFAPYIIVVIGLAIVFIFAFEVASSRERARYEQQRTSKYADDAEANIRRTCISVDYSTQAECIRQVIETSNEQQRAERDLSAQQEMARWAFYMLVVSSAGLVITAVGIYYVRNTLVETRIAVEVTREIGKAQVRAYIGSPRVEARIETTPAGDRRFSIKGFISNSGSSPALLPAAHCTVTMGDGVVNMLHAQLARDISAGETDFCFVDQGSPFGDEIAEFLNRGGELIFEGALHYDTVFGDGTKTTSFHLSLYRTAEEDGPLRVRMNGRRSDGAPVSHYRD